MLLKLCFVDTENVVSCLYQISLYMTITPAKTTCMALYQTYNFIAVNHRLNKMLLLSLVRFNSYIMQLVHS